MTMEIACFSTASKPGGPGIPETLPVYEEVLDPEEVKTAPGQYRKIGE